MSLSYHRPAKKKPRERDKPKLPPQTGELHKSGASSQMHEICSSQSHPPPSLFSPTTPMNCLVSYSHIPLFSSKFHLYLPYSPPCSSPARFPTLARLVSQNLPKYRCYCQPVHTTPPPSHLSHMPWLPDCLTFYLSLLDAISFGESRSRTCSHRDSD